MVKTMNRIIKNMYEIYYDYNYAIIKVIDTYKYYRIKGRLIYKLYTLEDDDVAVFIPSLISSLKEEQESNNILFKKLLSFRIKYGNIL